MTTYDGATCPCGSAWFRLVADGSEGAVCLDRRGVVSGYQGQPVCIACGVEWVPPRERLSVVKP